MMTTTNPDTSRLVRPLQAMSDDVHTALIERGVMDKYQARPAYQRNDYLMWINKAERVETRQKRLAQMLDELESGGVYMRMKWNG